MSALPDAPALVDEATVRKFLGVIHEQAASALNGASRPGLLQLTRLSPHDKNVVISGRFEIGDVDGMVSVALADASAGHNVYVEPRTIAGNTPRHARGGIEHTLGVFAFVIDSDADKGKAGRLTSAPSLEIETSPGNRHQWLFLDQALDAENAQPIGDLIRTATGADHCTGVIVQPYRVTGTPNYPNADKEAKGRTVAPTRILSATGQVWSADQLRAVFAASARPSPDTATPPPQSGKQISRIFGNARVLEIISRAEPIGERSEAFHGAVCAAVEFGLSAAELEVLMRRHPQGCAGKYLAPRDRLRREIDRSWGKKLSDDAESAESAGADSNGAAADFNAGFPPTCGPTEALSIPATPFMWTEPTAIPQRRWIYGRHFIRKFASETVSHGGLGKSSLEMTEALAIVTGRDLLGVTPDERVRVWYWNGENPYDELQRRLLAAALHYEIDRSEFEGRLFVDTGRHARIVIAEQTKAGTLIRRPVVEAVTRTIRENDIGLLIIDPFVSCHTLPENDTAAIQIVATEWTEIADAANCAVELVHHSKKTGGAEVTVEDGRGAVALLAKVRSARVLNGMTKQDAARYGIDNRRVYFNVGNGKANLHVPSDKADWFRLVSVSLHNGPFGGEGDSVGVVTAWHLPDPLDNVTTADLRAAQKAVAEGGPWRENCQAADWVGKPIARALRLDPTNKAHARKISGLLKLWMANDMFVTVTGKDSKRMERTFIEVGTWATD